MLSIHRIMSCNGCRILRKGCNENCILRQSLQGIDNPQAQANATVFVAKFFGRAGLISFLSSVPESQRPALFQSLLFEACGRTVNPVSGSVGLLWTGNWHVCQSAVETVLLGGVLRALPELEEGLDGGVSNDALYGSQDLNARLDAEWFGIDREAVAGFPARITSRGRTSEKRRQATPSDESETTTLESGFVWLQNTEHNNRGNQKKLLPLFF